MNLLDLFLEISKATAPVLSEGVFCLTDEVSSLEVRPMVDYTIRVYGGMFIFFKI